MAPPAPLTERHLGRATLARQGLLEPISVPANEAVARLGSLQAQHPEWPPVALAARAGRTETADLAGALDRREVVRSSLMRITIHVVAAADLWPMFTVVRPLRLAQWRLLLKADPHDSALGRRMTAAHQAAIAALRECPRSSLELDRLMAAEIGHEATATTRPAWRDPGTRVVVRAAWRHFAAMVPLVHVPHEGEGYGRSRYALASDWLGVEQPDIGEAEARVHVARRYLAAFGPASVDDLASYVGRGKGGIGIWRDAVAALGDEVVTLGAIDGRTLIDLADAARPSPDAPAPPRLLARWDSLLLSHAPKQRRRVIADEHRASVFSRNADVLPTFLVDGVVAGTWGLSRETERVAITLQPFRQLPRREGEQLVAEAERVLGLLAPVAERMVEVAPGEIVTMPPRAIIHADLDAFYASVEVLDDPSLRGRPVIVGGRPDERGVVSAASYEARRFGVQSAMPLRTAARRCPHGVFLPGRPERYRELSERVMAIFASYTPLVEPISLDEAFLDVSGSAAAFGDGETIARQIKRRVLDEVGLVVSVGVATNKLCAKVASDLRKPDALVVVPPGEEAAFLSPLPIRRLWGVGPQAQAALADYGVTTIGQLAALAPGTLNRRFGRHGDDLSSRARGVDRAPVESFHAPKSVGHEHTFSIDTADRGRLEATLLDLAESVASRLRRHDLVAGAVQLKLRYEGFETLTRQAPLPSQTHESDALHDTTVALLRRTLVDGRAVRLIGLTAISLADAQQLTLFDAPARRDRLTRSIDAVRERFGERAITRARLVGERPARRFDFGERPSAPPGTGDESGD